MVYIVDKICNYIIFIFLMHFCWRIPFRKNKACVVCSALSCGLAGLIDSYFGKDQLFVYIVWCFMSMNLMFNRKIYKTSLLTAFLIWFTGMIDTFSVIIVQIFFIRGATTTSEILQWWQLSAYAISFIIEYGFYRFILKRNNVYMDSIKLRYKIGILVLTMMFELVVTEVYNIYYRNQSYYELYLHIRFILCLFGVIYSLAITLQLAVKNYLYDEQNKGLKQALEIQHSQYLYTKDKNNDIRRFRHDLVNHIGAIQELLSKQQYESAQKYIGNIWNITESLSNKISTGDDYVDAVLNYYLYLCEKENVKVEINGKVKDKVEMDVLDITSLLGNALQNAYEATRQTTNRYVEVEIVDHSQETFLSISNTSLKMEIPSDYQIQTSKNDKLNHGFGLKNIVSIIKKYDGEYYITTSETVMGNMFKLEISIPRKR
ncbi:MAG: GHKL domain-containing protein [Pseudobutyrivibrio ruminis]|nr:GHKL domain-containing protein [Pseudobutyrivibrio ruminis]